MKLRGPSSLTLLSAVLLAAVVVFAGSRSVEETPARTATGSASDVPLKDAKLNTSTTRPTGIPASRGSSTARAGSDWTCAAPPALCWRSRPEARLPGWG